MQGEVSHPFAINNAGVLCFNNPTTPQIEHIALPADFPVYGRTTTNQQDTGPDIASMGVILARETPPPPDVLHPSSPASGFVSSEDEDPHHRHDHLLFHFCHPPLGVPQRTSIKTR